MRECLHTEEAGFVVAGGGCAHGICAKFLFITAFIPFVRFVVVPVGRDGWYPSCSICLVILLRLISNRRYGCRGRRNSGER